ncbi:WhiB family transcriptional regulator [Rhodococcus opacus]|uniref:WhiB family transcriptional regulator n=1 Tax=Rhodococcus opacus TaxID=37919 RepID=UPI0012DA4B17|nr:WhiB family transcriptional regulator [Rhodococcus opacus]MDX5970052.1 WhiB family transcriptional regulator [Rhodococcus opacus]
MPGSGPVAAEPDPCTTRHRSPTPCPGSPVSCSPRTRRCPSSTTSSRRPPRSSRSPAPRSSSPTPGGGARPPPPTPGCASWALRTAEPYGIWGGMSETDRKRHGRRRRSDATGFPGRRRER